MHHIQRLHVRGSVPELQQDDEPDIHIYCLKTSAGTTLPAYTIDTCADSDCSGCCTQNKGSYAKLIDVEENTNTRLGSTGDSTIQFADMGAAPSGQPAGCN